MPWTEIPTDFIDVDAVEEHDWVLKQLRFSGVDIRVSRIGYRRYLVLDEVFGLIVLWYHMNHWTPWSTPGFPFMVAAGSPTPLDEHGHPMMHFREYVRTFIEPIQKKGADEPEPADAVLSDKL